MNRFSNGVQRTVTQLTSKVDHKFLSIIFYLPNYVFYLLMGRNLQNMIQKYRQCLYYEKLNYKDI